MPEAVRAVLIMVSSALTVATLQRPPADPNALYDAHDERLGTWSAVLRDMPAVGESCSGGTRFEQALLDGIHERHTRWNDSVEQTFGPGVRVDMLMRNSGYTYPVHRSFSDPSGAAVSTPFRPEWRTLAAHILTEPVTGQEPLVLDVLGLRGTRLVKTAGEPIVASVNVDGLLEQNEYRAASLTAIPMSTLETDALTRRFAQDVAWSDATGLNSELTRSLTALELANPDPVQLSLSLGAGATGTDPPSRTLPQGLVATIRLPADWAISTESMSALNPDWSLTTSGGTDRPWELVFTLNGLAVLSVGYGAIF